MKSQSPKQEFVDYMGALHGANWFNASENKRRAMWADAMHLRKACGNKTWSYECVREMINIQHINAKQKGGL